SRSLRGGWRRLRGGGERAVGSAQRAARREGAEREEGALHIKSKRFSTTSNPCRRRRRKIRSPRLQAGERSPPPGTSPRSGRQTSRQTLFCRPLRGLVSMAASFPPPEGGGYGSFTPPDGGLKPVP